MYTADELITKAKEAISETIINQGSVPSTLFVQTLEGVAVSDNPPIHNPNFCYMLSDLLHILRVDVYMFTLENWRICTKDTNPLPTKLTLPTKLEDIPLDDRTRSVVIIAHQKGFYARLTSADIINTPSGWKLGNWTESMKITDTNFPLAKWKVYEKPDEKLNEKPQE